jgi:hypothetical protein
VNRQDRPDHDVDVGAPETHATGEVASEGGSSGDVEVGVDRRPGRGSEAAETWRPTAPRPTEIVRDETGEGRRSP